MAKSVSKVDQGTANKWSDSVEKVEQGNEKSLDCLAKSFYQGAHLLQLQSARSVLVACTNVR